MPTASATDLGDARLDKQSRKMVRDLAAHPGESFLKVWPDDSELEAAYRFFGKQETSPKAFVDAHALRSTERAKRRAARSWSPTTPRAGIPLAEVSVSI